VPVAVAVGAGVSSSSPQPARIAAEPIASAEPPASTFRRDVCFRSCRCQYPLSTFPPWSKFTATLPVRRWFARWMVN
jgi:hypothetical protein